MVLVAANQADSDVIWSPAVSQDIRRHNEGGRIMKEENKKKLEYEKPELVDFDSSKKNGKTAFGDVGCGNGSGDATGCGTGTSATTDCLSGTAASSMCLDGSSGLGPA